MYVSKVHESINTCMSKPFSPSLSMAVLDPEVEFKTWQTQRQNSHCCTQMHRNSSHSRGGFGSCCSSDWLGSRCGEPERRSGQRVYLGSRGCFFSGKCPCAVCVADRMRGGFLLVAAGAVRGHFSCVGTFSCLCFGRMWLCAASQCADLCVRVVYLCVKWRVCRCV